MPNVKTRIQNKHDVEANWDLAVNFRPLPGEIIVYDPDENHSYSRFKVGKKISSSENELLSNLPFVTDKIAANDSTPSEEELLSLTVGPKTYVVPNAEITFSTEPVTSASEIKSIKIEDHVFNFSQDATKLGGVPASDYVKNSSLATVATSGSYNDLSSKPTIPTVNNNSVTIKLNSSDTQVKSFTLNQAQDSTIDLGLATVAKSGSYNDLSNKPTLPTTATTTTNGLVKAGASGTGNGTVYVDASGKLTCTDTNTTYTGSSTTGVVLSGTTFYGTDGSWTSKSFSTGSYASFSTSLGSYVNYYSDSSNFNDAYIYLSSYSYPSVITFAIKVNSTSYTYNLIPVNSSNSSTTRTYHYLSSSWNNIPPLSVGDYIIYTAKVRSASTIYWSREVYSN